MIKTTVIAACATLAAIAATPASAAPKAHAWQVGGDSIHLYYPDLDLNSASGRQALLDRVEQAAARLCRDSGDTRGCVAATVAQTSRLPQASAVRTAMAERDGRTQLAAR